MEQRGTNGYIWMGTAVRYIADCQPGWLVHPSGSVLTNIRSLIRYVDENNMHVTRRVAREIERTMKQLVAERKEALDGGQEADKYDQQRVLTKEEAEHLRRCATEIRTTMLAEAAGQKAFITRDKRYSIDHLLDGVENLMPRNTFAALPDIARFDFGQAGRCIAFELPTAAAFHLMRGTEDTLRDFYLRIVRRDRVKPLMWGPMTQHMRTRRDTPPDVLMNNLDNIRKSFRNPTQHPDKVYDLDEAQDLFALSVDVVTRMVKHLNEVGK